MLGIRKPYQALKQHIHDTRDTSDVGWRIKQLRLRHGFSQVEVAERAGLDNSYLSRLESPGVRKSQPKRETVIRVLEALQATDQERYAVFQVEAPPHTPHEIMMQVMECAEAYEEDPRAFGLFDEHRSLWYLNGTARAIMGFTPEEYGRTIGQNYLVSVIDPENPFYSRFDSERRATLFSMRAAGFKYHFAHEEFSHWYLAMTARIREFPWAAEIWDDPPEIAPFVDSQLFTLISPLAGKLYVRSQFNNLLVAPRFGFIEWIPADEETYMKISNITAGASSEAYQAWWQTSDLAHERDEGNLFPIGPASELQGVFGAAVYRTRLTGT